MWEIQLLVYWSLSLSLSLSLFYYCLISYRRLSAWLYPQSVVSFGVVHYFYSSWAMRICPSIVRRQPPTVSGCLVIFIFILIVPSIVIFTISNIYQSRSLGIMWPVAESGLMSASGRSADQFVVLGLLFYSTGYTCTIWVYLPANGKLGNESSMCIRLPMA